MLSALVVEDDASVQALIAELLREEGFERIRTAASTDTAVAAAATDPDIDLVVLDYLLGGHTGADVAEQLRALPGFDAPILITTALRAPDAEHVCREAGACECVPKPFDIDEFLRAVRTCLEEKTAPVAA